MFTLLILRAEGEQNEVRNLSIELENTKKLVSNPIISQRLYLGCKGVRGEGERGLNVSIGY